MDTTQKNREETTQRRSRQHAENQQKPQKTKAEPTQRRPREQAMVPPPSAQQNNGAVRTEQEQRAGAPSSGKRQRPQTQDAPKTRKKTASGKATAPRQKAAVKKRPEAPKRAVRKADPEDISTKKRTYGKTKPKKNAVTAVQDAFRKRAEKKEKKKGKPKQPAPAVIYTQPQAFNRNRLLIQLATVTAIVAALVLGLSVFFKVDTITVTGAEVYSSHTIQEKSGIQVGDNLLTFSRPRAGALIKANLPYVDTVRFGIKLPGTVNIIIEEDEVVYAIKDQDEAWWLINSSGRVVEQGTGKKTTGHTQVLGVTLDHPVPDTIGVATEVIPTETMPDGELVPVTQTNAQRLTAALQILKALEANDIVGTAASVDVSRLEDIILWYGTRYQVNLGDSARLDYKIACMNDVILQMSDYQSGILDISFNIWPNQVGYTPFA